MAIETPLNTGK